MKWRKKEIERKKKGEGGGGLEDMYICGALTFHRSRP